MKEINKSIKTQSYRDKVMSMTATQDEYDMYTSYMNEKENYIASLEEEAVKGHNLAWCEVEHISKTGELYLNNFKGETVFVDPSKEPMYKEYISSLNIGDIVQIYVESVKGCLRGSFKEVQLQLTFNELLKSTENNSTAFNGTVIDKNDGGFFLDINGIKTFLPGSQATANKVENFNLSDWMGKEITVMVENYSQKQNIFIVSNKKYIKTILPQKIKELNLKKTYKGTVTGIAKFGVFVEFDEIFTGLIHKMEMDETMLAKFETLKPTDVVEFSIKEIQKDNRIILTTKDYTQTKKDLKIWFEDHKNYVYDVKVKKYLKNTGEYLVNRSPENIIIPDYALYGLMRTRKRLAKDDIVEAKLTGLKYHKLKLNFKLHYKKDLAWNV